MKADLTSLIIVAFACGCDARFVTDPDSCALASSATCRQCCAQTPQGRAFVLTRTGRSTDRAHDVACADVTRPGFPGTPDGFPDLIFAQLDGQNTLLTNQGASSPGVFVDESFKLPQVADFTSGVAACDLSGDSTPEIILANGDTEEFRGQSNRLLALQFPGILVDSDVALGFGFTGSAVAANTPTGGVSEEIECADFDGDGSLDTVLIGEGGGQDVRIYRRSSP